MTEPQRTEPQPTEPEVSGPEPTEPEDQPRVEVTVAAPPELVWRALRDPDLIRRWHGWHFEEGGGLDQEIRIIYATGVTEDPDAYVLQLGDGDRFSLHPTESGTIVRVTRAPRGAGDPEWEAYYDDVTEGWRTFLEQLRFSIERHDLAERRTITRHGALAGAASLVESLGLGAVADLPPGTPYRATAGTGDRLSGQVWARSPHQLALTVDGAGDGLLTLAEQPRSPQRPDGSALVVLTTYGLSEAAFDEMDQRWSAWWEAHCR